MRSIERLLAFASRWFDPTTVATVFEPMVADWQREWRDAARSGRKWVAVRGYAAFVATVIASTPRLVWSPLPAPLITRLMVSVGGCWLLLTALLAYRYFAQGVPIETWPAMVLVSLTFTLPFAMAPGMDAIRCRKAWPDYVERQTAVKLVAGATLWIVIAGGWIVPRAHYLWPDTARGLRNLTTYELVAGDPAEIPALNGAPRVRELNNRLSFAALPFLFAWMRWRSLQQGSKGWGTPLPASVVAAGCAVIYIMLRRADPAFEAAFLAPGFSPWIALVLFASIAFGSQSWIQHRRRAT